VVSNNQSIHSDTAFFGDVSGSVAEHLGALDWASSAFGPPASWSADFRALLRLVLRSKQPMFLVWGQDWNWLHNDAYIPIAGSRHPSTLGLPVAQVWKEAWSQLRPLFERVFEGESIHITDYIVAIERDGILQEGYFDFSYTPVRGDDGVVRGLFGVCVETTGRVIANRTRLEDAERERARLFEMTHDLFGIATFDGMLLSINPAWSRLLGRTDDHLLATPFADFIHPDDLATTAETVAMLKDNKPVHQFHVRLLKEDGSPVALAWSAVPEGPGSNIFYTVGRDITDDLVAAEELRQAQEALRQSQRMEALGNLTGGVAHDFNNLLQVVSGNLQLLTKHVVGDEAAERRIANALAGVSRGSKLASQLLAFGRRQALDPKVVDVARLVRGMDEMLQRTIGDGIEIETIASGGLWNSLVDPSQIENALLNLAINARDAMNGFGKLTIEVGNAYIDEAYALRHEDVQPGQYVSLSVTDTGSGMPAEIIEKAFEPFFSTKPEGKGTGLGLSMVYGFVKQTGGHVKIYSEVGHGTTVRLYLPRSMQREDFEIERSQLPVIGGQETILVAEDDDGVRATVVEMLQDLGYRILRAPDASAALSIIESGIHIDLLFTDVVMPGPLKSADLAKTVKERMPGIGVLFTSGYTENSIVHGGRLDPGVQLLSKPYTREQLARKIRNALDSRTLQQPRETAEPSTTDQKASSTGSNLSVLVVEDEPLIRMLTADMLDELDHTITEAGSGEEALMLLETREFDVVLSDLGLPGMSGEAFCQEVRRRWPHIALVFATGAAVGPSLYDQSRTTLLQKPFNLTQLRTALQDVLKR
jgi:PAS domain S-box-containing protein